MNNKGVTRVHAGLAQTIDRPYERSLTRREARPRGTFIGVVLKRVATAIGLFFLAKDVSLHVESVSVQRRRDVARSRLWSDGGGLES